MTNGRRTFLSIAGLAALAPAIARGEEKKPDPDDVGPVEDLMREHGVIRRVLIVYRESALKLRAGGSASPGALHQAAQLMSSFGEQYHEQIEEQHLFPAVKKAGGAAGAEIDTLLAQHQRGREITGYLLAVTRRAKADPAQLAAILEGFSRMYEEHAAREDTIIFPAWKKALTPKQLDELGDLFEEIEHKTFGKDGFDDAVETIGKIEGELGLTLAGLTAPPPPQA